MSQMADAAAVVSVGVRQAFSAFAEGMDGVANTFSATGLPPGLAINKTTGAITGTPTKAGSFAVKVSAKNKWKWTGSTEFVLKVEPLPAWAKGTFSGKVRCMKSAADANGIRGTAQLSVGSTGKISGKFRLGSGRTATFAFNSYTEQRDDGSFVAKGSVTVVQKRKKCRFKLELVVSDSSATADAAPAGGDFGNVSLSLVGTGGNPARTFGWSLAVMQVPETAEDDTF
ncbi:MAG: putative Ig domain-containing protein [Kiritimatiellae bacterium]|nr:putative Ig domain-containing protein [Kiritimatiellia bacterium]